MYFLLKLNVDTLVNRQRVCLLGNRNDLMPLTHIWDAMKASGGNMNKWLELHIIDQRCYMRMGQWI